MGRERNRSDGAVSGSVCERNNSEKSFCRKLVKNFSTASSKGKILVIKRILLWALSVASLATVVWYFFDTETAGTIILSLCAFFSWIFCILYFARSNWWVESVGRAMMAGNLFFAMVLTQNSFSSWTNSNYPFRSEIRLGLYAALFCSGFKLVATLWYIQGKERKHNDSASQSIDERN